MTTDSAPATPVPAKAALWMGRIISGLFVLLLGFDALAKVLQVEAVMKASEQMGFDPRVIPVLGVVLLVSTLLYAIPRTAAVGAILLTGYLGGAIATHMFLRDEAFTMVLPVVMGVLLWVALVLRDRRLRVLLPWSCNQHSNVMEKQR